MEHIIIDISIPPQASDETLAWNLEELYRVIGILEAEQKRRSRLLVCEECSSSFTGYRASQRFCSRRCRDKNYNHANYLARKAHLLKIRHAHGQSPVRQTPLQSLRSRT